MLIRKAVAFIKRDFIIESSYKFAFVLELLISVFPVFSFYFVAKLVGRSDQAASLAQYGGDYFPFVLIGVAFTQYFILALGAFSDSIRRAQMAGCLEAMLSTRTQPELIIVFSALYSFFMKTIHIALILIIGVFLLGADLGRANLLSALLTIVLTMLAFSSFGIFSASVIIILKKGDPFMWLLGSLSSLLGGALFPVSIMPEWMRVISAFIPMTHALEAMRLSVLQGYSVQMLWKQFIILAAMATILLPISVVIFSWAVARGRRDGTLMHY
jgi:ABC-2 type transport system permease protein